MISTNADADLAARRLFNRIFDVEHRPDGSFLLKSKRTGKVVAGGWRLNPDDLRTCSCGWSGTYRQANYDFAEPDIWLDACPRCGAVLSGEVAEEEGRHAGQEELPHA